MTATARETRTFWMVTIGGIVIAVAKNVGNPPVDAADAIRRAQRIYRARVQQAENARAMRHSAEKTPEQIAAIQVLREDPRLP